MDGDLTDQLTSLAASSTGLRLSIAVALLPSGNEEGKKEDKDDVNYGPPGPDDGAQRCSNCRYFDDKPRDPHCELVSGTISPNAICDLWDGDVSYPGDRYDASEYGSNSESSRSADADPGPISDPGGDDPNYDEP